LGHAHSYEVVMSKACFRIAGLATISLTMSACAGAPAPTVNQHWADGRFIAETTSWGKPVAHFEVDPDGTAEVWQIRQKIGGGFYDYEIAKFHASVPAEALAKFKTGMGSYVTGEISRPKCKDTITDAPSTSISWNGDLENFGVYLGCYDKKSAQFAAGVLTLIDDLHASMRIDPAPFQDWSSAR
jgi:hypothetical protein